MYALKSKRVTKSLKVKMELVLKKGQGTCEIEGWSNKLLALNSNAMDDQQTL